MFTIELCIQCSNAGCKGLPTDLNMIELLIEDKMSLALLELFETVRIKKVHVMLKQVESDHDDLLSQ